MLQNNQIKVDDKLLELISADDLRVNRYGLFVTIGAIVFVLIVCAVSLWFISDEIRKSETSSQAAVNQYIARQYELRTLALAHSMDAPSKAFYETQDCEAFSVVFTLYSAVREVVIAQSDGSIRSACRGRLYSELPLRVSGTSINGEAATVNAVAYAKASAHPVFSEPYTRGHVSASYVDLVIPQPSGETIIATISLTRQLRNLAAAIDVQTRYRLHPVLDGKIFPPDSTPSIPQGSTVIKSQLSPLPYNVAFLTVNTTPRSFPLNSTPARGVMVLAFGLLVTLTLLLRYQLRQMRSERELRARIAIQKTFSDSITDGLLVVGHSYRVLYANTAFEKLFGYESYGPVGLTANDAAGIEASLAPAEMFNGHFLEFERTVHKLNGSSFECHISVSPLKPIEKSTRSLGWLVTLRDITEQKRARLTLATEHQRTVLMIESMNAAVSVVHLEDDEPLYANALYTKTWGQSVRGHVLVQKLFEASKAVGHTAEIHDKKSGRWLSVTRSVLPWPGKGLSEMLAVTDVTDRKEVENRMQVQAKAAESAANLITMGEMASSMAHELNQPLAAVQNYASASLTMIQKGRMDEDRVSEALTKIINQTQRAAYIIRRIRSFAKSKGGEPTMTAVPVERIVTGTMELALMQAKQLGMKISLTMTEPDHILVCDTVMIEQVLLNLLKNAMEASQTTETDTVEFRVSSTDQNTVFEVADRGCGMPGETDKVFTPFFTTKTTGMGIGLNICRSVVENHRGRILISANPGGGTIVRVVLPNNELPEEEDADKPATQTSATAPEQTPSQSPEQKPNTEGLENTEQKVEIKTEDKPQSKDLSPNAQTNGKPSGEP